MSERKPNVVIILTDDLGYGDCSCYGQKTWSTPRIDQLALEGVRFTNFYSTSPVCSPARASLLTGLHSGRLPIRELSDPYLPDQWPTIPKLLREAGYVSACIGKYGVGNGQPEMDPIRKGFDYHYGYNCMKHAHNYFPPFLRENGLRVELRNEPPPGDFEQMATGVGVAAKKIDYTPDFLEEKAIRFIEACQNCPFFLHYCPTLPHANNEGGDGPDGMEVDTYSEFANRDWSPNEKGFARMIQRIDQTVGRIVDKLSELGLAENTLLLFTSDNGPHNEGGHSVQKFDSTGGLRGYKRSLHEGGIRVPCIAWWPGNITPSVSERLGYFPDILPTCLDMVGIREDVQTDGLSLLPSLTGRGEDTQHDCLYFEYQTQCAVRQKNWKYYVEERDAEECLYDLNQDRSESRNLATVHPDIVSELRAITQKQHVEHQPSALPLAIDPANLSG